MEKLTFTTNLLMTRNNAKDRTHDFLSLTMVLFLTMLSTLALSQPTLTLKPVVTTNLTTPMQVINAGDGSQRIFVVERAGVIKAFNGTSFSFLDTFLDIHTKVGTLSEQGLLSVVFHPNYEKAGDPNYGVLFLYYADLSTPYGNLILEKYKVSNPAGNKATVISSQIILTIPHSSQGNHNGGEMHFGKDGLLYLSVGDGGAGGDPNNNAQKTATTADMTYLLGKMLRIDVNTTSPGRNYAIPTGNPFNNEIFDYGLRNPFRWSFDRLTGDFWVGDVGQERWEEIDFRATGASGGINYGWNCFEGPDRYASRTSCNTLTNFAPAYYYDGQSVVGGVVYRGTKYTDMAGYYVGTDHYTGNFHLMKRNEANTAWVTTVQSGTLPGAIKNVTDIGESENGEIYAVSILTNALYHLESSGPLPVKLISFDGVKTAEGTRLLWETSEEENFREFEVEYSTDMNQFTNIGTVVSENSTNGAKYQFSHSNIVSGNAYYRLKMIDADASFEYSRIIVVSAEELLSGNFVRPSLINSGTMDVMIEKDYQSLELVNTMGVVMLKENISGKKGAFGFSVNNLSSGIYVVRLISNEKVNQQKILILH